MAASPVSLSDDSLAGDIDAATARVRPRLSHRSELLLLVNTPTCAHRGQPGLEPGSMLGVDADVVFLSIDGLAAKGERFAAEYWREVVTTGASLVICLPSGRSLTPARQAVRPPSQTDYDTASRMQDLSAADGVMVRVEEFERIDLMAPALADVKRAAAA